jgi:hypothetical protein
MQTCGSHTTQTVLTLQIRSWDTVDMWLFFCKSWMKLQIPYILESNPHLVFATFLNEKKLVRASNPHLSFNRPLSTGRLFE